MNAPSSQHRAPANRLFAPSRVALGVLLALGAATGAQAQSLVELYEAARGYDASFLSARSQVDAALARAEQAKAGLRPQAGLAAAANWSRRDSSAAPLDNASFNSQNVTLSASQPLIRPVNRIASEQGQLAIDIARAQLQAAEQDLIVRTTQAYFDVLAAQDTLTFVQAQKKAVSEQLAAAKRNFEVGTTTVTDSREAQARFDLVVAQEIAAENDL
ncbi:MAG: channel protein TolC, partial [Comamonadaceae bacterium]|nr:channel protein TolC [Comamonadaceae bacterium]